MDIDKDTIPDDLHVRFYRAARYTIQHKTFPDMFSRPFTVIIAAEHGNADIGFGSRNEKPLKLSAGDVCVCPANILRHTRSDGGVVLTAAYMFEIQGGLDLLTFAQRPFRVEGCEQKKLYGLVTELLDGEKKSEDMSQLQLSVFRQRIGYSMLECLLGVFTPDFEMLSMRRIFPAVKYLNEHFREPLDLKKLLGLVALSRTHFFRMFKTLTGKTPVEFLKRRRLREAMLLLQEKDLTIAEIGNAAGWPDQFYFSKLFKKSIGMSPSVYRQGQNDSRII